MRRRLLLFAAGVYERVASERGVTFIIPSRDDDDLAAALVNRPRELLHALTNSTAVFVCVRVCVCVYGVEVTTFIITSHFTHLSFRAADNPYGNK